MFELPPKRKRGRSPSGADSTPRPPGVHKRGKRIVSLLQTLQRQEDTSFSDPAYSYFGADGGGLGSSSAGGQKPNLLGVPGLTRQALDACVSAFFGSAAHITRLSQPQELFVRRVRVMLYETAGLEVPKDLTGVDAASELLALAVAALGAPSGPYPNLAPLLIERCVELASDPEYLAEGGLDEVEAVNLLVDLPSKRATPTGRHRSLQSNPLTLDPLGRAYPIELAIYHNVHIRPVQGEGVLDYARREALFWIVWASDAIRSTTIGAQCALPETDVGWPWHQSNSDDGTMPLARVARHIGATMLSTRARCTGLHNDDVRVAVNELDVLARATDTDLAWLRSQASGGTSEPASGKWGGLTCARLTPGLPAAITMLAARNLLYVVCWAAAKCDAAQHPRNLSARILERVEGAAGRATEHMVALGNAIAECRVTTPTIVSNRFVAFVIFLLHRLVEEGQKHRVDRSSEVVAHAEAIISTVANMGCYTDTTAVAVALRSSLHHISGNESEPAHAHDVSVVHELVAILAGHGIQTPFTALEI